MVQSSPTTYPEGTAKQVTVRLDSVFSVRRDDISLDCYRALRMEYRHANPLFYQMKNSGRRTGNIPRVLSQVDVLSDDNEIKWISFPRGIRKLVTRSLRDAGYEVVVTDQRVRVGLKERLPMHGWTVDQRQAAAAMALLRARDGLLLAPCGSGKTEILLLAARAACQRTLVVVPHSAAFGVWRERVPVRYGLDCNGSDFGLYGQGSKTQGRVLTVAMQQMLWRLSSEQWAEMVSGYGCIIEDEAHRAAARTHRDLFHLAPCYYRFGCTATLRRSDGLNWLVTETIGPVVYTITETDLQQDGRAQQVECFLVPTDFSYDLYSKRELAEAKRTDELYVPPEADPVDVRRREDYWLEQQGTTRREWTGYVSESAMSPARNKILRSILELELAAGRSVLVLVGRRKHARGLQRWLRAGGIDAGLLIGGAGKWRSMAEESTVRLGNGSLRVAIGTTKADEAFDAPSLEVVIRSSPVGSRGFGSVQQQAGRTKRLGDGKKTSRYYYLWDWKVHEQFERLQDFRKEFGTVTVVHRGSETRRLEKRLESCSKICSTTGIFAS